MVPGVRLVVLGKQGAGKGTQCVRLSHHYVVPHISTGDMLRAAVKTGSTLGLKVRETMENGELLGDDLIIEMVAERLAEPDARARGFILDGCPRTTHQAESLASPAGARSARPDRGHRGAHRPGPAPAGQSAGVLDCGANYSVSTPPKVNWICDVCGGEVIQREDDTEDAIGRRLELYERQTAPLIEWYESRGQLAKVSGVGSPDAVLRRVIRAVEDTAGQGEGPMRRNAEEIAKMRRAGRVVAEMHEATREAAKPGVTTAELDAVAREVLERRGAKSNFLHYRGFPAVICTSPNDMIVHGIPGDYVLEEGDILSIDCGAIIEGYHGDAAFTMAIGEVTAEAARLIEVTERSLWAGIEQLRSGNRLHEVGRAVQDVAEAAGFSVVREYVGPRHRHRHARRAPGAELLAGPGRAHAQGGDGLRRGAHGQRRGPATRVLEDGWSVVTADGRLSAHFEHTIAVTDDGPEVLTLP